MMGTYSLVLFVGIVEAGNLSNVARSMRVSQANINYRLTQLEKSVGQQLMRRTIRHVELTEIGQRLYQHGHVIRDELMATQESVAVFGGTLQGLARLDVPTGFGHVVVSGWLIEFKHQYPDIALDLLFNSRVDDLLRGEVDVAVRVMSEPPQQTVATGLAQVRYVTYASTNYSDTHSMPITLENLGHVPLITSAVAERDLRVSAYQDEQRHELILHPMLTSEGFQFLRETILTGLSVGLVPNYVVEQDLAEGRVSTTLNDWRLSVLDTRMFLLHMPGCYQTLATRTLIDFVVEKAHTWAD